jgi:hypothetical protein
MLTTRLFYKRKRRKQSCANGAFHCHADLDANFITSGGDQGSLHLYQSDLGTQESSG